MPQKRAGLRLSLLLTPMGTKKLTRANLALPSLISLSSSPLKPVVQSPLLLSWLPWLGCFSSPLSLSLFLFGGGGPKTNRALDLSTLPSLLNSPFPLLVFLLFAIKRKGKRKEKEKARRESKKEKERKRERKRKTKEKAG